ncbi:ACT domain-containing protein [Bacteroidota bacterium]
MQLQTIDANLVVVRLDPSERIPDKVWNSSFLSITRTNEELSIVCDESCCPTAGKVESGYGLIKIIGPLDINMTGILAQVLNPLTEANISVFTVSTFDTDYVLVKKEKLSEAGNILSNFPDLEIV